MGYRDAFVALNLIECELLDNSCCRVRHICFLVEMRRFVEYCRVPHQNHGREGLGIVGGEMQSNHLNYDMVR